MEGVRINSLFLFLLFFTNTSVAEEVYPEQGIFGKQINYFSFYRATKLAGGYAHRYCQFVFLDSGEAPRTIFLAPSGSINNEYMLIERYFQKNVYYEMRTFLDYKGLRYFNNEDEYFALENLSIPVEEVKIQLENTQAMPFLQECERTQYSLQRPKALEYLDGVSVYFSHYRKEGGYITGELNNAIHPGLMSVANKLNKILSGLKNNESQ